VNLIGEHTDYNDGLVLPVAIDRATWVAIAPRDDRRLAVRSVNVGEAVEIDLAQPGRRAAGGAHWSDYVRGVAAALAGNGFHLRGADLIVEGDVPIGAGLASSASLEVAVALALADVSGHALDRLALARLCQQAEHAFAGTRCGIMDQVASCCGRAGHALWLDCRSLEHRPIPMAGEPGGPGRARDVRAVVCNTMVKHDLAAGQYNRRRAECEAGVDRLSTMRPGIAALRDVTLADLDRAASGLPRAIARRCRHVVTENARVDSAARALAAGEIEEVGRLMAESHRSLRDDYEVSCDELDAMVDLAGGIDGVIGARMTGGGFGGCTVNLVWSAAVPEFTRRIAAEYEARTGRRPDVHVCVPSDGASRVA
jgi:galactokinase